MIHLVGSALERHLRQRVPLPESVVVSFDAPDKTWSARVNGPTVNCYLWDFGRNRDRQHAGVAESHGGNGTVRRRPDPVMEFRYLVTGWSAEVRDEHQLLGSILVALLSHPVIERADLPPPLDTGAGKLSFTVDEIEDRRISEVSSALDGQLKAGLRVAAVLAVDAGGLLAVGPPTAGIALQTTDTGSGATTAQGLVAGRAADPAAVGATVRTPRGAATVGADGRFTVPGRPGDTITLDTEPPRQATVPDAGIVELS